MFQCPIGSTPFDADIEKVTDEKNATENWALILDICDRAKQSSAASKACLKSVLRRMRHKVPYIGLQALTLLNACVKNCGYTFHLEVASREFVNDVRSFICEEYNQTHPKVVLQLKLHIKSWAENEFKSDSALNLIPTLYKELKDAGQSFVSDDPPKTRVFSKDPNVVSSQEEEDDIVKAIALSLKDAEKQKPKSSQTLYPAFNSTTGSSSGSSVTQKIRDPRKVRALYDFEAVEENELTFKAGELIGVLDDSDQNWWKGVSWRGEGLFPANFVSSDLDAVTESGALVADKQNVEPEPEPEIIEINRIDEEKIDTTLAMIQNADPTGERCPDPQDLVAFESQCKNMGPLIDQELERIDRQHGQLMELNTQLMDSLQMYHGLMRDLPAYGYTTVSSIQQPPPYMSLAQMFPGQQMLPVSHIPQGITAQVGPSSMQPGSQPQMGAPPPTYMPQFFPPSGQAYYDQNMSYSNINNSQGGGPTSLPTMPQQQDMRPVSLPPSNSGPTSLPYSSMAPVYNITSPTGVNDQQMMMQGHPQRLL